MAQFKIKDYAKIIRPQNFDELQLLAERVRGKTLKMVNSTAVGGGVAEILSRFIPLINELGVITKWEVIKGSGAFFGVTKAFHNALHGSKVDVYGQMFEIFRENNEENRRNMTFDEDFVVIHDPQPAGLIESKKKSKTKWVWRCHIDLSNPQPEIWNFLKGYVSKYDGSIFSTPWFAKELPIPQYFIFPAIDPLSEKNKDLTPSEVDKILRKYNIDRSRPIVTQISRFDRLKDPVGVIKAYKLAKKHTDCQLVLAGGSASDDPEGAEVLEEVKNEAGNDPDIHILSLPPFADLEINALQRASTIVMQKSLREGFGLTVTEALWKGKPVIASAIGGITLQVIHNFTGLLVHSVEGAAYQIRYLLNNPQVAERLGRYGKEQVREKFLITRILRNYLLLLIALDHPNENIIQL
ncbi:MAG: glycosyltransferase [Candidatus Margulisbacteria bacterium]|nr:glycosyltransferase [Candidatus Margulisiibacteriota bacterium]MBU1021624.1 glycosyltransferase [Candidatus Margulisiibacteriota bacterium]MBU1728774.1 glycosyltransferase [Candidatus Margulisiibacteriota bacterium]MBU1955740.1 glycosyltransferase [Candidatus Margulisiibacteriota bacterium]